MPAFPQRAVIREVGLRDGLQSIATILPTERKQEWIRAAHAAGQREIEVGSFVPARLLPQLADTAELLAYAKTLPGLFASVLVPNLKGAERALAAKADELNLVMSASQTHNRANMRMSCESSLTAFGDIVRHVKGAGVLLNASVATAFGCPFEGTIDEDRVVGIVDTYREMGIEGITLADTTGMANPRQVARLVERVLQRVPSSALTLHFHNTRGLGLANVLAAYEAGARRFDAALGGLGGCPFAPGATGNVVFEDLAFLCESKGFKTGIDIEKLVAVREILKSEMPGEALYGGLARAGLPRGKAA